MTNLEYDGNLIRDLMDSAGTALDRNGVKPRKLTALEMLRFLHDGPELDEDDYEVERR